MGESGKKEMVSVSFVESVRMLLDELEGVEVSKLAETMKRILWDEITAKDEALKRRSAYTQYITSKPNTDEREKHRKRYHDMASTHKNFSTSKETRP
jgi:hypothetical protein